MPGFVSSQAPSNPETKVEIEEINEIEEPMEPVTLIDVPDDNFMPIKSLSTFTRDWVIKARVSSKQMRTTQKGGQLLKIELVDSMGTAIEATAFNDEAKKFDPMVEEDKVYTFSDGNVKIANRRFTTVKNDFCIIFNRMTKITQAVDNGTITKVAFEFTNIADLEHSVQVKTTDLLCVIVGVGETEHIKRKTGENLVKKTFLVADTSDASISLSLWGESSIQKYTHLKQGQVLAIKTASVGDFGGKSLSYWERSTQIIEDYEHADVTKLQNWYRNHSDISNIMSLTQQKDRMDMTHNRDSGDGSSIADKLRVSFIKFIT